MRISQVTNPPSAFSLQPQPVYRTEGQSSPIAATGIYCHSFPFFLLWLPRLSFSECIQSGETSKQRPIAASQQKAGNRDCNQPIFATTLIAIDDKGFGDLPVLTKTQPHTTRTNDACLYILYRMFDITTTEFVMRST